MKALKRDKSKRNPSQTFKQPSPFSISFQSLAFKIFGGKSKGLASALHYYLGLDISKSGFMMTPEMYASLTAFSTLLVFGGSFVTIFVFTFFLLKIYYMTCIFYSGVISIVSAFLTLIVFSFYPSSKANSRKTYLEAQLPYSLSYMAVMAKAGAIPEEIFESLAKQDSKSVVAEEARRILRDVAVFGRDILSSLAEGARRSPSRDFTDVLWGLSSTLRTGGSLSEYLEAKAKIAFDRRRIAIRKFIDNLSLLGEFYISIFVAAPLIFVVLLIVMTVLGGTMPLMLGLSTTTILGLITYVYLPFMAAFLIMLIDLMQPKE